jgi:two-component system sensor histidine kinase DesK
LAGLTALTLTLSLAYGSAFLWLFVGLSAAVGVVLSAQRAFWTTMALTLATLGLGMGLGGGPARTDWLHLIPLVLLVRGLGLDMAGLSRLAGVVRELHAARGELARQAVTEERLRLARDLHDLLGYRLSLIALKSELAGRLIEAEPARAAQEIRDVEWAARQALQEVREAVAGYRQPTLLGELEAARQLLAAAGIAGRIEAETGTLPASVDAALAWAVREGVTNVIRHSQARECTIHVTDDGDGVAVTVCNDGYGTAADKWEPTSGGSGLAGLAERVQRLDGSLDAGPGMAGEAGEYRLRVALPMKRRDLSKPRQSQ